MRARQTFEPVQKEENEARQRVALRERQVGEARAASEAEGLDGSRTGDSMREEAAGLRSQGIVDEGADVAALEKRATELERQAELLDDVATREAQLAHAREQAALAAE